MRIMASRASCLLVDDMQAMELKAVRLIAQDRRPAVALVAQRVVGRAFRNIIVRHQLPFQQRREPRSMWTVRARATRARPRVAVVAIGTINHARHPQRLDQAWHLWIATRCNDRMKTLIGRLETLPRVRLIDLPRHRCSSPLHAVAMATETKLILHLDVPGYATRRCHTSDTVQTTGRVRRRRFRRSCRM